MDAKRVRDRLGGRVETLHRGLEIVGLHAVSSIFAYGYCQASANDTLQIRYRVGRGQ